MPLKDDWQVGDPFTAADANEVADEVNGLTTDVAGKADSSRTVSAGTGLTGGGDLSANRTLAADFGSGAGKVCQGNDSRLSDARTPTAHTHGTSGLTDGAVTTAKIADENVTAAKFAGDVAPAMQAVASRPRATSAASAGTLTVNVDATDQACLTAQAAALTVAAPTGTKYEGQKVLFRFKDNGTARAITWNAVFVGDLPTTTTVGKTLIVGVIWDDATTKWACVAKVEY